MLFCDYSPLSTLSALLWGQVQMLSYHPERMHTLTCVFAVCSFGPLGESEKKVNAARVVSLLEQAGAAAVIIHGRTMEQR